MALCCANHAQALSCSECIHKHKGLCKDLPECIHVLNANFGSFSLHAWKLLLAALSSTKSTKEDSSSINLNGAGKQALE